MTFKVGMFFLFEFLVFFFFFFVFGIVFSISLSVFCFLFLLLSLSLFDGVSVSGPSRRAPGQGRAIGDTTSPEALQSGREKPGTRQRKHAFVIAIDVDVVAVVDVDVGEIEKNFAVVPQLAPARDAGDLVRDRGRRAVSARRLGVRLSAASLEGFAFI